MLMASKLKREHPTPRRKLDEGGGESKENQTLAAATPRRNVDDRAAQLVDEDDGGGAAEREPRKRDLVWEVDCHRHASPKLAVAR